MKVQGFTVGPLQENCWLVVDEVAQEAVLVDPGAEASRLLAAVDATGARLTGVWITHGHVDHVGAVAEVVAARHVPVWMHPADRPLYDRAADTALMYGMSFAPPPPPDHDLAEGDVLTVGSLAFTVWHLPGHAPGHVAIHGHSLCLGGDLLFAGSIGRTDLPLSDPRAMQESLARLATLPPDTKVLPGHGEPTTIAHELAMNPFLRGLARPVGR
jgi:glyoxylase-like metal-dependent hydrolase (beta-lactamase superfamily II)